MSVYDLGNLVKQKICFKNQLLFTNSPQSFLNSSVFKTALSDFHKLTTTVLKQYFSNLKAKVVKNRDYRKFRYDEFVSELDNEILKHDTNNTKYQHFLNIFIETLNKHTPLKQKYLRAHQGRFVTKGLHKAIMKRFTVMFIIF